MCGDKETGSLLEAVGHQFAATATTYSEKDAALYALSIGASADPMDTGDLQYTYELAPQGFSCFPTFAATFPLQTMEQIASIPGQRLNLMEVLHGEHTLKLIRPLPPSGLIVNRAEISQVYDKGSGALIIVDITSSDEEGRPLALNQASIFIRGRGNFGGDRGPSGNLHGTPERAADVVMRAKTNANQALLYRLASGDRNPLHADSRFAALLGYPRPILHGLCTYGYAARAVLGSYAGNEGGRLKEISARFSSHLFPGETIETEMWQVTKNNILFRCRAIERDEFVLTNGRAALQPA